MRRPSEVRMSGLPWLGVGLVMVVLGVSCESSGGPPGATAGDPGARPATFNFGQSATPSQIAALDIDVGPDGAGAPPGSGSVEEGKQVYAAKCAVCHGLTCTEGPNDVLVGRDPREGFPFGATRGFRRTVGNYWPYATTLFDYINRTMPFTMPGSLTADEVYAAAAYILYLNEIISEDAVMNAQTLPAVVMPARDRFVPDNRTGGSEIR